MADEGKIKPHKDWTCSELCPSFDGYNCEVLGRPAGSFCQPKIDLAKEQLKENRRKALNMRSLIHDLTHRDECDLDCHGACQAHNWFGEGECPHARAQKLLERKGEV